MFRLADELCIAVEISLEPLLQIAKFLRHLPLACIFRFESERGLKYAFPYLINTET